MKIQRLIAALLVLAGAVLASDEDGSVVELTQSNFQSTVNGQKAVVALFSSTPFACPRCAAAETAFAETAAALAPVDVQFVKADCSAFSASVCAEPAAAIMPCCEKQLPPFVRFYPRSRSILQAVQTEPQDLRAENKMATFSSRLRSWLRQRLIAELDGGHSVLPLTNDTLLSIAVKREQHLLILFTGDRCDSCVEMHAAYSRLAAVFASLPSVVVGAVNVRNSADAAIATQLGVSGYPTLLLVPAVKVNALETFSGEPTLHNMLRFMNEHTAAARTRSGWPDESVGIPSSVAKLLPAFLSSGVVDRGILADKITRRLSRLAAGQESDGGFALQTIRHALVTAAEAGGAEKLSAEAAALRSSLAMALPRLTEDADEFDDDDILLLLLRPSARAAVEGDAVRLNVYCALLGSDDDAC